MRVPQSSQSLDSMTSVSLDDANLACLKRVFTSCVDLVASMKSVHSALQSLGDSCAAYSEELDDEEHQDSVNARMAMYKMQELSMRVDSLLVGFAREFQGQVVDSFARLPGGVPEAIGAIASGSPVTAALPAAAAAGPAAAAAAADSGTDQEEKGVVQTINVQTIKNFQSVLHQFEFVPPSPCFCVCVWCVARCFICWMNTGNSSMVE